MNPTVNFYYMMKCSYTTVSSFLIFADVAREILLIVKQINDSEIIEKLTSVNKMLGLIVPIVSHTDLIFNNFEECMNILPETILWYCQSITFSIRWGNIWSSLCKHLRTKGNRQITESDIHFELNMNTETDQSSTSRICDQITSVMTNRTVTMRMPTEKYGHSVVRLEKYRYDEVKELDSSEWYTRPSLQAVMITESEQDMISSTVNKLLFIHAKKLKTSEKSVYSVLCHT